ncbi:MFS transporter [Actinoplanes sp. TBRC 11911]|nr:MFS transporter [Actinoplanes sp. TBRC 11911]
MWFGQALSSTGNGVFTVALAASVLGAHRTADLGYVVAADGAGLVAVSLLGGVLADRFRRSRMMIGADALRFGATVGFGLGAAAAPLPLAVVLAALMGVGLGLFQPAYGALVPSVVPQEGLAGANALVSITNRFALVAGPAVGGLILTFAGPGPAFWLDAGSFGVSMLMLLGLGDARPERQAGGNVLTEAKAGLALVRERRWVLTIILQGTLQLLLVMSPALVLLPILLQERGLLAYYGLMTGLQAVGAILGGMLIASWKPRLPGAVAVSALALLGLQLVALALELPLFVLGAAMVATGAGYAVFGVLWYTALQKSIPEELRGRVMSVDMLGTFGLAPVGLALAPLALGAWGERRVLLAATVVLAASTIVPLLRRDVRTFDERGPGPVPLGHRPAEPVNAE